MIMIIIIIMIMMVMYTRSYAALRAADLDWIVRPVYSLGRVHNQKRHVRRVTTDQGRGGRAGINKNVTH